MKTRLIITGASNLADTAATLYLFGCGYAEANPIMAWLLQWPGIFALIKIAAVTAIVIWLWHGRHSQYARLASWLAAVIYGAIALYYVCLFIILV